MSYRSMQRATLCLLFALLCWTPSASAADLDLSAYKGKVVYLDFWASWCTPCRQSFPWMSQIQQTHGADGLVVIAINVDHDKDLAETFLKRFAPQFKIVYDAKGEIASKYAVKDMPTSFLIGRDGRVRYTHAGFFANQKASYDAQLQELLNEQAH
jgi:thiol-disulfide isomerase/thioredoxin